MADLIETILHGSGADLDSARRLVVESLNGGDRDAVARTEHVVRSSPGTAITFDENGFATVCGLGGGRFSTPTIAELAPSASSGTPTLSVLEGDGVLTDIGALQAFAPTSTLFQVASQFNCLEAPGPSIVPVSAYLTDPTQGPRAAVSAFAATLVRHYRAPDGAGGRFEQEPTRELDLLATALTDSPVRGGYLQSHHIHNPQLLARQLRDNFEQIRVGLVEEAEVVLGADWSGAVPGRPRIAQVCTSTLASGGYGQVDQAICQPLLRAAYLGTLLAATRLGKERVVLTMIGGGVFGNPHSLIVDSILWACERTPSPMEVILNARALDDHVDRDLLRRECAARGGRYRALTG